MSNDNSMNDLAEMFSEETGAAGLLGNEEETAFRILSPHDIEPDPDQPRKRNKSDRESVQYILDDFETEEGREEGITDPITVRPLDNGRYMIVHGENRWTAAKIANLPGIPAIIKHFSESEEAKRKRLLDQIKNNQQHKTLDVRDEGLAYLQLQQDGYSIQKIADHAYEGAPGKVKKLSREQVSYRINLAKAELSEDTMFISELYDEPDESSLHRKRYTDLKLLSSLYSVASNASVKKVKALALYLVKLDKLDRKSVTKLKKLDYSKPIKDLKRDLMTDPEEEALKESASSEQASVETIDRQSEGVSDAPEPENENADADMSASEELPQSEDDVSPGKTADSGKQQEIKRESNTEVVVVHVSVEGVNYLLLADQPARKKGHVVLCEPASGAVDEFPLKDVKVTKLELVDES
jgi:ParB/RepB/Spo0J family partition protein